MPNIKSAKKRVITNNKKHENNLTVKSELKTEIKKAKLAIANNAEDKEAVVKATSIALDEKASKGIIHKNAAARKKSRLAKALNAQA